MPQEVYAALSASSQKARVSFTFDDGFASTYTHARPIIANANLTSTVFVTTSFIGTEGYMTWEQVQALQNTYGWEVGNHTVNHAELPLLTTSEIRNEIANAQTTLSDNGITSTSFATPFGAYDNRVLIEAAKHFTIHRGFHDRDDLNVWPYNTLTLQVQSHQGGVTLDEVKAWVERAKAEKKWLILVFHDVADEMNPDYEYTTTTADFQAIVDYVKASGVDVVNPNVTLQAPGVNLLTNSGFTNALDGWTNDSATITHNTNNNGRYPSPQNSVRFTNTSATNAHLFSSRVPVTVNEQYLVNAFVNANALTAGTFRFYMDEYDAAGNWISGQNLGTVTPGNVIEFNYLYTPTSTTVAQASVQLSLDANSQGNVFVDEVHLYAESVVTPTPTPTTTTTPSPTNSPTPTPTATNTPTPTPTAPAGIHIEIERKDGNEVAINTPYLESNGAQVSHVTYEMSCYLTGYVQTVDDANGGNGWDANFVVSTIPSGTDCIVVATAKGVNGSIIATSNQLNVTVERITPILVLPYVNGVYNDSIAAVIDAPGAVWLEMYLTPEGHAYRGYRDTTPADGWTHTWSLADLPTGTRFMVDAWVQYPDGRREHTNVVSNLLYDRSVSTPTIVYPSPQLSVPNNQRGFDSDVSAQMYAPGAVSVEFYLTAAGQGYRGYRDTDGSNGWSAQWNLSDLPEGHRFMIDSWVVYENGERVHSGVIENLVIDRTDPTSGSIVIDSNPAKGLLIARADGADAESGIAKVQFLLLPAPGSSWIESWDYNGVDGWRGQWTVASLPTSCNALVIAYIYDHAGHSKQTGGIGNICIVP